MSSITTQVIQHLNVRVFVDGFLPRETRDKAQDSEVGGKRFYSRPSSSPELLLFTFYKFLQNNFFSNPKTPDSNLGIYVDAKTPLTVSFF